jgi:hypothetical protein
MHVIILNIKIKIVKFLEVLKHVIVLNIKTKIVKLVEFHVTSGVTKLLSCLTMTF